MKKFAQNLAALVKVKTIVTLVVILVFTILALRGAIDADSVMYVVTTVVAFYFGTQHEKTGSDEHSTDGHAGYCPFMTESSEEEDSTEEGVE